MTKTLSVSAIEHGVVIDHIPAGQAVRIVSFLGLANQKNKVTIGLNLRGRKDGLKDLIKIEGRSLTACDVDEIAVFAPNATINVIKDFKVVEKSTAVSPESIIGLWLCPNSNCITNCDQVKTRFNSKVNLNEISLQCHYCEKKFTREEVKDIV